MKAEVVSPLFATNVFARGEAYLREGRVRSISLIAPGLFHGEVEGGSLYDVVVRIDDVAMRCMISCSCPFAAKGRHCKHSAAMMLAIGGVIEGDIAAVSPQDGSGLMSETWSDEFHLMRMNIYDEVRSRLVPWYGTHGPLLMWDEAVVKECPRIMAGGRGANKLCFPVLSELQAGRMAESFIQAFLESGGVRNDVGHAFEGADIVLDNALAASDYGQALSNALLVMRIVGDSLEYIGDDGEIIGNHLEHLSWKVRLLVEKTVDDERSGVRTCMVAAAGIRETLLGVPRELGERLGTALLSFSRRRTTRRIADETLTGLERSMDSDATRCPSRLYSYMCRLRHDDLVLSGEYDRAELFESDHADDEAMAWLATVRSLLADAPDRGQGIVDRYRATVAEWNLDSSPIPSSPCTWMELLVAIAQRRGDNDALERLRIKAIME